MKNEKSINLNICKLKEVSAFSDQFKNPLNEMLVQILYLLDSKKIIIDQKLKIQLEVMLLNGNSLLLILNEVLNQTPINIDKFNLGENKSSFNLDFKCDNQSLNFGSQETVWINDVIDNIKSSMPLKIISIESLSTIMNLSPRQLSRKLIKIKGLSAASFIREIQLQEALKELENENCHSIKEVCYMTGFNYPSNFSRIFKSRFGITPFEYLNISVISK